ncbi:iron transporter [Hypericibacter adhaerens]|jgi:ferrous-iron efflux pump FieF|uniref:Cation-efflux pump FieF n=1 Tax=Hypericibacter adhaerens TaxID=2602016 RepID=A0A5J6N4H6_9PROT|nr:cation diffusion facilitator family transporter [Hypericibacter adhaerens]QEX23825.1 iron transporter [Hypericibacter adhaerens]
MSSSDATAGLSNGPKLPPEAARLMRLATYASMATAVILILAKAVAYLLTDSVSMLSTLLDSLLDAAASLVNLLAVRHALTPADREHRFGHGKAEALSGLGQSAFIAGSALFLFFESAGRLVTPQPVVHGAVGIGVMLFSMAMTFVLVLFQRSVIRRTGSIAVSADSLHYVGDIAANLAVLAALVLSSQFGWERSDPIFAIGVAFYIILTAWQIARGSFDMLMDREMPDEERQQIRAIVMANPRVRNMHDLRTRRSGPHRFIQFHLEMDPAMRLTEAHELSDEVEAAVLKAFPTAEVIIHEDPEGVNEGRKTFG